MKMKKGLVVSLIALLVMVGSAMVWARSQPKCYSQPNCQGSVIATCDADECDRRGGKSWSNEEGECYADMGDN